MPKGPKGLYFTAEVFPFFLLLYYPRLISEVTEQVSIRLKCIFTYDCYLKKFGPNVPRALTTTGWSGVKNAFGDRL